jgi:hypothetical protein
MVLRLDFSNDSSFEPKTQKKIAQWNELSDELNERELPSEIAEKINPLIERLSADQTEKVIRKKVRSAIYKTLELIRKELKWVPQSYYQNMWTALGMSAFGISIGVAFSTALDNLAYLGLGLPIGLVIGMAIGRSMDDKAKKEGKQLNFKQSL